MSRAEKLFWIALTIGATLFGTGLLLFFESSQFGWATLFTLSGVALMVSSLYEKPSEAGQQRLVKVGIFAVVLTWLLFGLNIYDRHYVLGQLRQPHEVQQRELFLAYGGLHPFCTADINGRPMGVWQREYRVALICGISDPSTDRYQDQNITITPLFTIEPADISISVPFSDQMKEKIKGIATQIVQSSGTPPRITLLAPSNNGFK